MIPVKLYMKNFLSYLDETVDYGDYEDPIVLINGINNEAASDGDNNGAGKSSLFDAVLWCLYGRVRGDMSKELVKDDVIHIYEDGTQANFVRVEFIFKMDEGYFSVKREKELGKSSDLDVKFSHDGESWDNLSLSAGVNKRTGKKESSIARTQQKIDDVLNTKCKLFINSCFFEQGGINKYALSGQNDKTKLLREALYLDKWIDFAKHQKIKLGKLDKKVSAIEYFLSQQNPDDLEEKNKAYKETIERNTEKIEAWRLEVNQLENERSELNVKRHEANEAMKIQSELVHDLEVAEKAFEIEDNKLNAILNRQDELGKDLLKYSGVFSEIDEKVEGFKSQIAGFEDEVVELEMLEEEDYSNELREVNRQIGLLQGEASVLNDQKTNFVSDCPLESNNCSRFSEEEHKKKIKKINGIIFGLNRKINRLRKEQAEIDEKVKVQVDNQKKRVDLNNEISKLQLKIKDLDNEYEKAATKKESVLAQIDIFKKSEAEQRNSWKFYQERVQKKRDRIIKVSEHNLDEIEDQLEMTQQKLVNTRQNIKASQDRMAKNETMIKVNEDKIKQHLESYEEHVFFSDKRQVMAFSSKMLNKDIPHQLIECALPEIEGYAQEYLERLSLGRMNIQFKTQREINQKDKETKENLLTDEIWMDLEVDGVNKKYALCSGGEKCRADIAIHLAYATFNIMRSGPKIRTLFLDEVGMALDDTGRKSLVGLFKHLIDEVGFEKIFLISQDEKFNKLFDCMLTVKKTSTGSEVVKVA